MIAVHGDGAFALERAPDVHERAVGPPRVELAAPLFREEVERGRRAAGRRQKSSMIWS
jgi:hypothetical protein